MGLQWLTNSGGVLTLKSYTKDFHFGGKGQTSTTKAQSLAVSLQNLGAFVACFFIWPINKKLGRKPSLILSSFVFCIGVIIQTINTHSLAAFYVARVIAGLGLGGATVVVPMYSGEMTPKELRGQIGCFFQLFYTLGIFTSYWVDYGVSANFKAVARQWQIPIGLQLLPAGLLLFGMFTLPESLRWYVMRGEHEKAWNSLRWVRASDGLEVKEEWEEIKAGIKLELQEMQGLTIGGEFGPEPSHPLVYTHLTPSHRTSYGQTTQADDRFLPRLHGAASYRRDGLRVLLNAVLQGNGRRHRPAGAAPFGYLRCRQGRRLCFLCVCAC